METCCRGGELSFIFGWLRDLVWVFFLLQKLTLFLFLEGTEHYHCQQFSHNFDSLFADTSKCCRAV